MATYTPRPLFGYHRSRFDALCDMAQRHCTRLLREGGLHENSVTYSQPRYRAKLTPEEHQRVLVLAAGGVRTALIAQELNTCTSTIRRIVLRNAAKVTHHIAA